MRIGFVIYGDLATRSGGYTYDRMLINYLKNQGDTVQIFSLPWRNYVAHLTDNFHQSFLQDIINSNLDIMIQDELNHPSLAWLNDNLKRKTSFPIISILHHLRSKEIHPKCTLPIYSAIEKKYLNSLDAWIPVSNTTHQDALTLTKQPKPHIIANPSAFRWAMPLEEQFIQTRARTKRPLHIVFLANILKRKGLHILLDAVSQLPSDIWKLDIIGNPNADHGYTKQIKAFISTHNIQQNISFKGWMEDHDLEMHLKTHDILCVPSSYEGFGMVYLEGMGLGLPAIGTERGAAKEIITHETNGYLIKHNDAITLAQIFIKLHDDRPLLEKISLNARKRYDQQLTWEETGEHIRKFLVDQIQR